MEYSHYICGQIETVSDITNKDELVILAKAMEKKLSSGCRDNKSVMLEIEDVYTDEYDRKLVCFNFEYEKYLSVDVEISEDETGLFIDFDTEDYEREDILCNEIKEVLQKSGFEPIKTDIFDKSFPEEHQIVEDALDYRNKHNEYDCGYDNYC